MPTSRQDVKTLRQATGAGIVACRDALAACNGDMDGAKDWLRTRGVDIAESKVGRKTPAGLVSIRTQGSRAGIAVLNCETDFAAQTEAFQEAVQIITLVALDAECPTVDTVLASEPAIIGNMGTNIADYLAAISARIGEAVSIGWVQRFGTPDDDDSLVCTYLHGKSSTNIGLIGTAVQLRCSNGDAPNASMAALGHKIAMHVAAAAPTAVSQASLDPATVSAEGAVYRAQAAESGKPEAVVDKIVSGKIEKWMKSVCLMEQPFVQDTNQTIAELIADAIQGGVPAFDIVDFARVKIG